ncbi:hypothetical protein Vafri_14662 [Volvox africanus]|uniref:Retrotransposon gag domain-containing protein n=1 Tax=Volvox africanus TaxID=51714 RepID=A0A8J4F716_9CHLO|nr:hypothetical protein Vafri_14662 [Volvox africanus]
MIVDIIATIAGSSVATLLPKDALQQTTLQAVLEKQLVPAPTLEEVQSLWVEATAVLAGGSGSQTAPKHSRPNEVSPTKRLPHPPKFSGKKDSTIICTRSWFNVLMRYFDLMHMDPFEHIEYFMTGKAQIWASDILEMHRSGKKPLTRDTLRAAFLLQYGDTQRNTAMAARDRLHAHEHDMKPTESVAEYTQRFHDVLREAKDMDKADQISWYIKGLVPTLRGRCATDDEGKDWQDLDKCILYATGQEVRWKAGKDKSATVELKAATVTTPKPKQPYQKRPPPRSQQGWQSISKKPRTEQTSDKPSGTKCRYCHGFKKPGQSWQDHVADCTKAIKAEAEKKLALAAKLESKMQE